MRARLSQKESRELADLPAAIEGLEDEQGRLQAGMADPAFFRQSPEKIREHQQALVDLEARLAERMTRWEVLLDKEQQLAAGNDAPR